MSNVEVNSVQPSEIGPSMVAYYLTVAMLTGEEYSKGYSSAGAGIPILTGYSEEKVLRAYAKAALVVDKPWQVEQILAE